MQVKLPWLKPALWGAVLGSVATMILGFGWMGWTLGGTAERMAAERANGAVVVALTPSCISRFMQQPNAAGKQRECVEAGGWATPVGDKAPNSELANACAERLLKTTK